VRKVPSTFRPVHRPARGDDLPSVYSGTLVTAGQGIAEVIATGAQTELGKIGKALQQLKPEQRLFSARPAVSFACSPSSASWVCARGGGLRYHAGGILRNLKEGFLAGIGMAMPPCPRSFRLLTVFLALGAWRISRSRVLTRRMPAIESLGAATVLCVDKTER